MFQFSRQFATYAHFPQFLIDESGCGERTALATKRVARALFSGEPLISPTLNQI
jgi:hypothetical protein